MSRQAAGFSSHLDSQEQHLAKWVEARKRERRLYLVPKTEAQEELEMAKIEGIMDGIGICIGIMTVIGVLVMLII